MGGLQDTPTVALVGGDGTLEGRLGGPLREADFDVVSASSGAECLPLVRDEAVDGVVSRHDLPGVSGVQLLRSVRVLSPKFPFLLAPAAGSEALAAEAIDASVSGYIPVGAAPETAVTRIRRAFRQRAADDEDEGQMRYRHLVEASPAPINLFDRQGTSVWCNEATLDMLEIDSRDEFLGRPIFEFIHPADRAMARRELQSVIDEKRQTGPTRMTLRTAEGNTRHVVVSTAVGDFLGADVGQAVLVDITDLRQVENELRREQRLIENALNIVHDAFYIVDENRELHRWNATVPEVTGYFEEELRSIDVLSLFAEADRPTVRDSFRTVLREGSDAFEATVVTKQGRRLPYEFRTRLLESDIAEEEARIVGVGRDVSQWRERERQLKVLETWLRHNIRTEVNLIHGLAETLAEENPESVAEHARTIQRHAEDLVAQANREREIVNMLTDPPDTYAVDVREVVEEQARLARERYPAATIRVGAIDGGMVRAIPELADAVRELVENAVVHNDTDSPTVELAVTTPNREETCIHVTDDGPGIPEVETEILQLTRDIDQLHHGSGLGLLYVHWVARVTEGHLRFESNDPRGSTVTIALNPAEAPAS